MVRLPQLADLVFGHGAALPAVDEVNTTLVSWRTSAQTIESQVTNATLDLLITCGSPRLEDVPEAQLVQLVPEYPPGTGRRHGLFKVSRVLAHKASSQRHSRPTIATVGPSRRLSILLQANG